MVQSFIKSMSNVSLPSATRGDAIGGITGAIAGGAIGGYFANQGNSDMGTTALVGAGTGLVGGTMGSATGYGLEILGSNIANRISNDQANFDMVTKNMLADYQNGILIPNKTVNEIPINNTSIPSQPVSQLTPIRQPLINIQKHNKYYYDFNIGSPRLKPTPTRLDGVADIQIGDVNKTPMREINQSATNTNLLNNRTVKEVANNIPVKSVKTGNALGTVAKVAIPLAVLGGIGYGGYHVATADDRARAKLEQEQLDNFNSILQAQKDREMVNEYIKQQKLKEQYETEKQLALINQLGNVVNNISPLPYDVNNYLYTEQLMTPSY